MGVLDESTAAGERPKSVAVAIEMTMAQWLDDSYWPRLYVTRFVGLRRFGQLIHRLPRGRGPCRTASHLSPRHSGERNVG